MSWRQGWEEAHGRKVALLALVFQSCMVSTAGCETCGQRPSLDSVESSFTSGVSRLSKPIRLGPLGTQRVQMAVHNLGLALSFCSCSVCKKKQNRHFIVPASRFKLLKVSAKSRVEDAEPVGESPADSTAPGVQRERSTAGPLWGFNFPGHQLSCLFLKCCVIFFPYILDTYLILLRRHFQINKITQILSTKGNHC